MKCKLCQIDKLSREFPREALTDECSHPPYICLRCVTTKVRNGTDAERWKCPTPNCGKAVKDSKRLIEFERMLEFMFPPIEAPAADLETTGVADPSQAVIHITKLTGDTESIPYDSAMTVVELKKKIKVKMQVEIDNQRLVYKEKELKSYKPDHITAYTLADFGVKPFCTIHLMVLLFAIPENLDHVIFDLSWHYPTSGRDFIDASCLMFMGDVWYNFIDWRNKCNQSNEIWHSGDTMDDVRKIGHHKIEAKLKNIPKCVSHLVFVLSSFRSPTLSRFPNLTMKFYDARDKSQELVSDTFPKQPNCEALIVCCVSRTEDDTWGIFQGGQQSAGNARQYHPIIATAQSLIRTQQFKGVSLETGTSRIRYMNKAEELLFQQRCKAR